MIRAIQIALAGAWVVASCAIACAQPAETVRLRGTIEKADGNALALKGADGAAIMLTLTNDARGTQKALEVHIFPEQMRGTGEGHRPYPPVPNSTMTNGTASGVTVAGVDGSIITVKYKDGEKKIVVPPGIPIVRYEIGSDADLSPGAHFTVLAATKKPDGTFEANRINVGRDGVVPQ